MWSRHSRRTEPRKRSQMEFMSGAFTAVRSTFVPKRRRRRQDRTRRRRTRQPGWGRLSVAATLGVVDRRAIAGVLDGALADALSKTDAGNPKIFLLARTSDGAHTTIREA